MKRIQICFVAAVLLLTYTASADLMVYDYLENGEKVTLDTATGKYWYWNLNDFAPMPYAQQISTIGGISPTYGWIAGGWHMASLSEMEPLWTYSETNIKAAFGSADPIGWSTYWAGGRYNSLNINRAGAHYFAGRHAGTWVPLETSWEWDYNSLTYLGAFVTTDATVVPAPPAVVMAATGFTTLFGAKLRGRWRRR